MRCLAGTGSAGSDLIAPSLPLAGTIVPKDPTCLSHSPSGPSSNLQMFRNATQFLQLPTLQMALHGPQVKPHPSHGQWSLPGLVLVHLLLQPHPVTHLRNLPSLVLMPPDNPRPRPGQTLFQSAHHLLLHTHIQPYSGLTKLPPLPGSL